MISRLEPPTRRLFRILGVCWPSYQELEYWHRLLGAVIAWMLALGALGLGLAAWRWGG